MTENPSLLRRIDNTHLPMLLARLIVGGDFIVMAVHKIAEPVEFLKQIREYHLLPDWTPYFINMTAIAMPWVEILCGILLIIGFRLRGAAALALLMLTAFTIAILIRAAGVYNEGGIALCDIKFDCGCGAGVIRTCLKVPQNLGLMVLALVATLSRSRRLAIESLPVRPDNE